MHSNQSRPKVSVAGRNNGGSYNGGVFRVYNNYGYSKWDEVEKESMCEYT